MAVRPTVPADYPRMVTDWNQQEENLRADGTHARWTEALCAQFLRSADVHGIDEASGVFLVFHKDENGWFEGQGFIGSRTALVRVIRFCAPLFDPADVIYWMLGPSASQTIKTYFMERYTLTAVDTGSTPTVPGLIAEDGRLYFETTAAQLGALS